MRAALLLTLLVLLACADSALGAGSQWKEVPSGVTVSLRSVCFGDKLHAWAVGDKGTILATVDGGKKWVLQKSDSDGTLRSVHFLDKGNGWIVGDGDSDAPQSRGHILIWPGKAVTCGTFLVTADCGKSWSRTWVQTNFELRSVWMVSKTMGQICNYGGPGHPDGDRILTSDAGRHWSEERVYRGLNDCFWIDDKTAWAVGSPVRVGFYPEPADDLYTRKSARIVATADAGANWTAQDSPPSGEVRALWFTDRAHGVVVGDKGAIQTTSDGGKTWTASTCPVTSNLNDVVFLDAKHGWIVGASGTILETVDGGKEWKQVPCALKKDLRSIHVFPGAHPIAVGDDGTILRRE